jgi:hypothetical protein
MIKLKINYIWFETLLDNKSQYKGMQLTRMTSLRIIIYLCYYAVLNVLSGYNFQESHDGPNIAHLMEAYNAKEQLILLTMNEKQT